MTRCFLGAFGDPGHAFPMLALGARSARGHEVTFETWARWREYVEAEGMRFAAAPEYPVFPTRDQPLQPYEAVVRRRAQTRAGGRGGAPDVVVARHPHARAGAGGRARGRAGRDADPPRVSRPAAGAPPYAFGARLPRTGVGRRLWRLIEPVVAAGLRRGTRRAQRHAPRASAWRRVERLHGGLSERLCMVATFPQLEYPRDWPAHVHVVGPLMWEPPYDDVEPPPGDAPLVLVAPSTAQDPEQRLLRAALAGSPASRCACSRPGTGGRCPSRSRCRPTRGSSSGSPTRARCRARRVVVCHAGHGTMVRALACGRPVVGVPHAGDMAENAARPDWAGVGVRLPWRLLTPPRCDSRCAARWPGRRWPRGRASWRRRPLRTMALSGRRSWLRGLRGPAEWRVVSRSAESPVG